MASLRSPSSPSDGYKRFSDEFANTGVNNYGSNVTNTRTGADGAGDTGTLDMGSRSSLHTGLQMSEDEHWEMNYHEAAIYLEEGLNNEKFDSHPSSPEELPAYLRVHNPWYHGLDLLASLVLILLAFTEDPAVPAFELPVWAHGTIELLALAVIGVELHLKLKWIGWTTILKHKRTMIKGITLLIMVLEAVVVLCRQSSHFRVTRALRPIFLVDTRHCGGVRRFIRQILQSLPPILDMLGLLMFFVATYSLLGYYLFSEHIDNGHFKTISDSFVSMFVLLTTANFPDVMMPSYAKSKWYALFFILYIITVLYVLMNLMLAVVYETFTRIEREKCRALLLHRRVAARRAFRLLVSRRAPHAVRLRHFAGLMRHYAPHYNALIIGNGVSMVLRVCEAAGDLQDSARLLCASWDTWLFLTLFLLEAALRMMASGLTVYLESGWNVFDLSVTLLALVGAVMLSIAPKLFIVVMFRPLRLMRLYKLKKRYRDVFGTLVLLSPLMSSAGCVMLVMYYFFAIVGMELFAGYDLKNCCVKGERWQLQLKGSGQTPYARMHDGRSVLRSSIREMVASEACYHLGIPTTRAAALVVSDDFIIRDQFYSGCPRRERAAILLRLSSSWFRFGSLEILAKSGEISVLRLLAEFAIKEYFPEIHSTDENRFIRLFSEVAHKTLDLVAKWQGLGFAHGLLNTDNMSLLGLTLDYGPFGFVDSYDGGFVPNCVDGEGRYALAKQPDIVTWNIGQLANALKPLLTSSQQVHLSHILKTLDSYCKNKILETFLMKIGLKEERWGDEQLVEKLLDMMQQTGADFTLTFRQLSELEPSEMVSEIKLEEKWSLKRLSSHASWGCWLDQYRERLDKEAVDAGSLGTFEDERRRRMLNVNPVYVPRNWLLHEAIQDAEMNDFGKVRFLLDVMRNPYAVQPEAERRGFSAQPPQWAYALKISCSS